MTKWAKPPNWEEIPFDENATPEQKGAEFDNQWRVNKDYAESNEKMTVTDQYPDEKGKHRRV